MYCDYVFVLCFSTIYVVSVVIQYNFKIITSAIYQVGYRGPLLDLALSDTSPELMEIWNTSPQEILDFKNLIHIEVCNCSSLKYLFTPSMALSLKRLHRLEIKECSSMEEVIREHGVEEEATTDKFTFPWLSYLTVESCSNFRCFYLGSRALEFPSLLRITIAECPKMSTFFSPSSRNKEKEWNGDGSGRRLGQGDLNIAPTFFSDKVSLLLKFFFSFFFLKRLFSYFCKILSHIYNFLYTCVSLVLYLSCPFFYSGSIEIG